MMNKKILIADDELAARESLKILLDKFKYEMDEANNGARASELIKNNKYDFIFLDCNMPELTGIELIDGIKRESPESRIVIITGYGGMTEEFACQVGAHEYIEKPFSGKDLEKIIRKYQWREGGNPYG